MLILYFIPKCLRIGKEEEKNKARKMCGAAGSCGGEQGDNASKETKLKIIYPAQAWEFGDCGMGAFWWEGRQ